MLKKSLRQTAIGLLIAALLLYPVLAAPAVSAHSAVVMDTQSGKILFSKNEESRSLIASTTKIMTGLLVAQDCSQTDPVTVPPEAVGIEGSSMYLKEGETLTVKDLLYGLMLRSGNDAAVALALHHSGSVEAFSEKMNEKAAELGLKNTHFANPHGLDSQENYSTALDLAKLAAHALNNDLFRQVVSTQSVNIGDRTLINHNKLLWQYPGTIGVKTGYTKAAGRILVSACERDGRRLIAVTLNAPSDWSDHKKMLDYGYSLFSPVTVLQAKRAVASVPCLDGTVFTAAAGQDFTCRLAEDEETQLLLQLPKILFQPPAKGTAAGTAHILLNGKLLGSVELIWQ